MAGELLGLGDLLNAAKPVGWTVKALTKVATTGFTTIKKGEETAEAKRKLATAQKNAIASSSGNRSVYITSAFKRTAAFALPCSAQETLLHVDSLSDDSCFRNISQKSSVNLLASGGNDNLRNSALTWFCCDAIANHKTVIVLHCKNHNLQKQLTSSQLASKYRPVDGRAYCYNPFSGKSSREVASLLFEAIPEKYKIPYTCKTLIEIIAEIKNQSGETLILHPTGSGNNGIADCPVEGLITVLDKRHKAGKINDTVYNRLLSDYVAIQNDAKYLRAYFDDLKRQLASLPVNEGAKTLDFKKAVSAKRVISIDVSNQANDLYLNIVTEHLRELLRTNQNIAIVIDGISLHIDNKLIKMLQQNQGVNFAISIKDAYASIGAKKDELNSLLGGDCRLVLSKHGSPRSAEYWSEYFGEYERTEIVESFTEGERRLLGPNELKQGWSPHKTKERKIDADVFKNMTETQFCAYDAASGNITLLELS